MSQALMVVVFDMFKLGKNMHFIGIIISQFIRLHSIMKADFDELLSIKHACCSHEKKCCVVG